MAVPGLQPLVTPWASSIDHQPTIKTKPPTWLAHDMTPREPYNQPGGASKANSNVEHTLGGASVSATAEMNTGMPSDLYKPVFGEPQKRFYRKGYFRNPDLAEPRQLPKEVNMDGTRYAKHNLVSNPPLMPPSYAVGKSEEFLKGGSAPDRKTRTGIYARGKDEVWDKTENLPAVFENARRKRDEFTKFIKQDKQLRDTRKKAEIAKDHAPPKPSNVSGPWSGKRVHDKMMNPQRNQITTQQRMWEEAHTNSSYLGSWVGREGCGAPLRKPDGSIQTNVKTELETHLHNEYQTTADAASKYAPNLDKVIEVNKTLKKQIAENMETRRLRRERSQERIMLDDGGCNNFGKNGGGAPRRDAKGEIIKVTDGVLERTALGIAEKKRDEALGKVLRQQANEQREMRRREAKMALTSDVDYQPFQKKREEKKRYGSIESTKAYGMSDPADAKPVEGASLINSIRWGSLGGGAPSKTYKEGQPCILARTFHGEEEAIEAAAQAKGESPWGKPGAGGPVRNADGSIKIHVLGSAENDLSGLNDHRRGMDYRNRVKALAKEQAEFMKQHRAYKREQRRREKETDDSTAVTIAIDTAETRYSRGNKVKGPRTDLYGNVKTRPRGAMKDAEILRQQIDSKTHRKKMDRARDKAEEAVHLQNATKWQGRSDRRRYDPRTKELTGKYRIDRMLHQKEFAGKLRTTEEGQKAYREDLDKLVASKNEQRARNRQRKIKEEKTHQQSQVGLFPDYVAKPGRRKMNSQDFEYKLLTKKSANLQ